jgi:hypothetical protein
VFGSILDDTADDFSAGNFGNDAAIEAAGAIGPSFVVHGCLRATASTSTIANVATVTFEELAMRPVVGVGIVSSLAVDFGARPQPTLGLSGVDNAMVLLEGELLLDQPGMWSFLLTASDVGFFELAAPGSDEFVRVAVDGGAIPPPYPAAVAGWYRIRGAISNVDNLMSFSLRLLPPGGEPQTVPPEAIRAPAADLSGLLLEGFEDPLLIQPTAAVLVDDAPFDAIAIEPLPDPLGMDLGTFFSLRWSGQFRVDRDGVYGLQVTTAEGHRVWVEGELVADDLAATASRVTTAPARQLAAGWHPIVIDMQRTTSARPTLTLALIDGASLLPLAPSQLRPAVDRRVRWFSDSAAGSVAIPDDGIGTRNINVTVPPDFVLERAVAAFDLSHDDPIHLAVALESPDGIVTTLADFGDLTETSASVQLPLVQPGAGGMRWVFTVTDNTPDTIVGTSTFAAITQLGGGGPSVFAPRFRFESRVFDLDEPRELGAMTWGLRQDSGAPVAAEVRSCETVGCVGEPWGPVAFGATPQLARRRYVQYAITVDNDGTTPTALDWVRLEYR